MKNKLLLIAAFLGLTITQTGFAAKEDLWIDGTHFFDKEVRQLTKSSRLINRNSQEIRRNARAPKVGDVETFWTKNIEKNVFERTPAILKAIGKHCYVYVEQGQDLPGATTEKIKKTFDENIYGTVTSHFGSEFKPGVDGDERITLLMLDIKDGYNGSGGYVAGYFFPGDEYLQSEISSSFGMKSNEREMFYLDLNPAKPDSDSYMAIVAHEFQHMIHFNQDKEEYTWVNESCSQIAPYFCGFGHARQISAYKKFPDNGLTAWASDQMLANYGQVYLWNYYLLSHFLNTESKATDFFRGLVANQKQGIAGVTEALKTIDKRFTSTFSSFIFANYLNNKKSGKEGEYSYDDSLADFKLPPTHFVNSFPAEVEGGVRLWSGEAIEIDLSNAAEEVEVSFSGFMGTFAYYYENEFTVALVKSDSSGNKVDEIEYMRISPLKERKSQGGKILFKNDGSFDRALVLMLAYFPTEVDDLQYCKALPMKYRVKVSTSGTPVVAEARVAEDLVMLCRDYQSKIDENSDLIEADSQAYYAQLDSLLAKISFSIARDVSINNCSNTRRLLKEIESKKLNSKTLRPVIDEIEQRVQFKINHR